MKPSLVDTKSNILGHHLPQMLKKLMAHFQVTDSDLSSHIGIPVSTITKLRLGISLNPTLETLLPIARYFKMDVEQLLGFKEIESFKAAPNLGLMSQALPIIEAEDAEHFLSGTLYQPHPEYVQTTLALLGHGFSLLVRGSMITHSFSEDAALIFDDGMTARDRDYVIVIFDGDGHPVVKQILFDGVEAFFKPFNPELGGIMRASDYRILAVMRQIQINIK